MARITAGKRPSKRAVRTGRAAPKRGSKPDSGAGDDMKITEFTVGAKIQHACFQNPLPLMGVKKGAFREDVPVAFRFKLTEEGWRMDQLLHQ